MTTAADCAGSSIVGMVGFELHGMVCFDLFVCNNDRKPDNLIVGEDKKVWLIDHANSLFYRPTGNIKPGIPRLIAVEDDLRAMFDKSHSFIKALQSWEYIDMWCERISRIPSHFIRFIIDNLPSGILNEEERTFLFKFLERERKACGILSRDIAQSSLS